MTGHNADRATGTGIGTTPGAPGGAGGGTRPIPPARGAPGGEPNGTTSRRNADAAVVDRPTGTRRGVAGAEPGAAPAGLTRGELVVAGLVAFTTLLALAIASPALPAVERDLAVGPGVSRWVVLGYGLAAALAAPFAARRAARAATRRDHDRKGGDGGRPRRALPGANGTARAGAAPRAGRLAHTDGPRRALLLGAAGFAAATAVCAVAPWIGVLLAGRVVQGAFAGALAVLVPVLAARGRRPVTALGVTAAAGSFGLLAGAAAGGGLVPVIGWRGVLLLHVPLAAAIVLLAVRALPDAANDGAGPPDGSAAAETTGGGAGAVAPYPSAGHPHDMPAARTTAGERGGRAPGGQGPPAGPASHAGTGDGSRAATPYRPGGRALVALLALAVADGAALVVYPFFLFQGRVQQSTLPEIGLALGAMPIALVAATIAGGRFADRRGPLPVAIAGALVTLAGMLLVSPLDLGWSAVEIATRLLVVGVGMGLYGGAAQAVALLATGQTVALRATTSADARTGTPPAAWYGVPAPAFARAAARVQLVRYAGFVAGPPLAAAVWAASGYFSRTGMGSVLLACAAAMLLAVVALIPLAVRPSGPAA